MRREPERGVAGDVVEVRNVSKRFRKGDREFLALEGVDLRIREGEFVSLVGPSGCGKSTLLRMIGGLTPTTTGQVSVEGHVVDETHRDVALMFQAPTLFPWRTVLDNVLLPLEIDHRPTKDDVAKARALVSLVGLDEFVEHHPRELSGGMQQRVALSRVLVNDPRIMLLDEPFGALDEFTREALNVELADIVGRGKRTVVLVTHSVPEAVFLADRVVAMGTNPGRILGEIQVPFHRPREASLVRSSEFQDLTLEVRKLLGLE
ncbi:MAG: ATP-binding cassette domain-containing protein [Actinobacteria bacterium]|nr:ATP-binding cassette domain-containing protein [Actinomycetota bacterium]